MIILKTLSLMVFSLGVAILAKYWGFYHWVEVNSWIGLPMAAAGAVGICSLFGREN